MMKNTYERRQADLFFAELMGRRTISRSASMVGEGALPTGEQQPAAGRQTAVCADDVAVTDNMALLVACQAPLPVTPAERQRVAFSSGARDDYRSVAAIVPSAPEQRLLIFLHGNSHYVTVARSGDVPRTVDPSGHSRVPRWADSDGQAAARQKRASPILEGFESLAASQNALKPAASFTGRAVKDPVVLTPEDAERSTGRYWSVPPAAQYGSSTSGTPTGPGTTILQDLVMECYEHLRCLRNPSGRPYLAPEMTQRASWAGNIRRVYLSGHSGGGAPLIEAAGADMMLVTSSSVAGVGGRAVDLWLLDCTYAAFGSHNYVNFCTNWKNAGLLGYGATLTRFVCVFRPGTGTATGAGPLRTQIAGVLKVPEASLLKVHKSKDMSDSSMVNDVIPALTSSPVTFISTPVDHPEIPSKFIPLLLRTAAS